MHKPFFNLTQSSTYIRDIKRENVRSVDDVACVKTINELG